MSVAANSKCLVSVIRLSRLFSISHGVITVAILASSINDFGGFESGSENSNDEEIGRRTTISPYSTLRPTVYLGQQAKRTLEKR